MWDNSTRELKQQDFVLRKVLKCEPPTFSHMLRVRRSGANQNGMLQRDDDALKTHQQHETFVFSFVFLKTQSGQSARVPLNAENKHQTSTLFCLIFILPGRSQ